MSFKVFDVKGDGHCYYRCIYHLAMACEEVSDALYINHMDDEDEAVQEIRYYVSMAVKFPCPTRETMVNLIKLHEQVPSLVEDYPILKYVDHNDSIQKNCERISLAIENSSVYASSVEHGVVQSTLADTCDIQIVILHCHHDESLEDLVEKWKTHLWKAVIVSTCRQIMVLVNKDNIHYQYVKINGKIILSKDDVLEYLNDDE